MTYVYEFLAIMWMSAACAITFYKSAASATFAAGLSIASATLAIVHEHRQHRKPPRPSVYTDVPMEDLLEETMEEEPDDDTRMPVPENPESDEGRPVGVS